MMNYFHHPQRDPFFDSDNKENLAPFASNRIKRDLMCLAIDAPSGLLAIPDDSDIRIVHAIIVGPKDSLFEGGFFYLVLKFPNDYPFNPPQVKFMTTDRGKVQFNKHIYPDGKIYLNILGTYGKSAWSPVQHLTTVLLSIQSLLCDDLPCNCYVNYLRHETLRVAVCGMLQDECNFNIPQQLRINMEEVFLKSFDRYAEIAHEFQYFGILRRLNTIKANLVMEPVISETCSESSDSEYTCE